MSAATCSDCARSVWRCEGRDECVAYIAEMSACSSASHARMKAAKPSALIYKGVQQDETGAVAIVFLDCPRCSSTLGISPEEFLAGAMHPPRFEVVR